MASDVEDVQHVSEVRDARFDVLRLLAMYMIVVGHFVNHGIRFVLNGESPDVGFSDSSMGQVNFVLCQFLGYATNVGPNLFFLMTGFFLVRPRSVGYAVRKAFHLWLTMVLYGLLIYGIVVLCADEVAFEWNTLALHLLPLHEDAYWFLTVYVALLLLSPFLAKMATALTQREYGALLLVLLLLNFGQEEWGYGIRYSGGMSLFFSIFLFLFGGYVRLYQIPGKSGWLWGYVLLCLGMTAMSALGQIVLHNTDFLRIKALANNSLPLFSSVCLFLWFSALKPMKSKFSQWAVKMSPYILVVYLIHENVYVRSLLWNDLMHPSQYVDRWWLVPCGLVVSAVVVLLCVAIDAARQRVLRAV